MKKRYEVQTPFIYGYENCWSIDDEPSTFPTKKAAMEEIKSHCRDCKEAYRNGDMSDYPRINSFLIVEVQS